MLGTRTLNYLAFLLLAAGAASAGLSCNCGWVNTGRIVGGSEAPKNKYPMVAMLEIPLMNEPFCGGTIITEWHVLTAAHCPYKYSFLMQVRVGAHRRRWSGKTYGVAKVITHEHYNKDSDLHDIALLVTKQKMKFDANVGPACLPNRKLSLAGQKVIALGWGLTTDKGSDSKVLREVVLGVTSVQQCRGVWGQGYDPNLMLCSYAEGKDTCQGDSGGPLIWLDPETKRYTLAALVSFGAKCGGSAPGVNTDVSAYIGWINQKIAETKASEKVCTKV